MSTDRAAEYLAHRVLEQWCLIGEEPMSGEQWESVCDMAGVNAEATSVGALYLRSVMSLTEREARMRQLAKDRSHSHGRLNGA